MASCNRRQRRRLGRLGSPCWLFAVARVNVEIITFLLNFDPPTTTCRESTLALGWLLKSSVPRRGNRRTVRKSATPYVWARHTVRVGTDAPEEWRLLGFAVIAGGVFVACPKSIDR
jgi:hypothetical protein